MPAEALRSGVMPRGSPPKPSGSSATAPKTPTKTSRHRARVRLTGPCWAALLARHGNVCPLTSFGRPCPASLDFQRRHSMRPIVSRNAQAATSLIHEVDVRLRPAKPVGSRSAVNKSPAASTCCHTRRGLGLAISAAN